ncbi:probable glutamate receptor [Procambarus clarkii]|uniref:probable glutamate receptor n=1 Tax=Procambarus clarkii TaxID=6728 RepID=UPI003742B60E
MAAQVWRRRLGMVLLVLWRATWTSGFLQSPEGQMFFTAYISALGVKCVNVFLPAGSMGGGQVPVGVLRAAWSGTPLSLALKRVRSGRDVGVALATEGMTSTLNVAFLHAREDLSLFVEVTHESLVRHHSWLVLGDSRLLTQAGLTPRLPLDNLVTFASFNWTETNTTNVTRVDLSEIYTIRPDLPFVTHRLGSWRPLASLKLPEEHWSERRTNLTGLHLRCVTLSQPPFLTVGPPDQEGRAALVAGYVKDVWDALQDIHGFTYACRLPEDGAWGSQSPDGRWNGLVREVVEGRADVVVASLDHNQARAKAIDFLFGLKEVGYRMVVRRPGLGEQPWKSFTAELLPDAWLGTIAFVVFVPPCLALCAYFSPFETEVVTLKDAYIVTIGALAIQGSWLEVQSTSSRIVFTTIFFATLLVYAYYTSALVSILTVASTNTGFSSLQSLLQDGTFQFGFATGTFLEEEFKNAKQLLFKEVWQRLVAPDPSNLVHSHQEGIRKVIKESYVYMMEENGFHSLLEEQCEVVLAEGLYFSTQTGLALDFDSPLKRVFDAQLMRLRDGGLLSRLWQKWQPPPTLCTDPGVIALNMRHLFTAFLLLLLGVVLAALLLPCERLHWNIIGKTKAARDNRLRREQGNSRPHMVGGTLRNTGPSRAWVANHNRLVATLPSQNHKELIAINRGFRTYLRY